MSCPPHYGPGEGVGWDMQEGLLGWDAEGGKRGHGRSGAEAEVECVLGRVCLGRVLLGWAQRSIG